MKDDSNSVQRPLERTQIEFTENMHGSEAMAQFTMQPAPPSSAGGNSRSLLRRLRRSVGGWVAGLFSWYRY